jgi:hypothetical protein
MPINGFICPDGKTCNTSDCMKKCRISSSFVGRRCLPEGFLLSSLPGSDRPKDILSVTELSKPLLQLILERNINYYVNPMASFAAIRGSASHYFLEKVAGSSHLDQDRYICERRIRNDLFSGQIDVFDRKDGIIWDYKFVNAYKLKLMKSSVEEHAMDYVFQQNAYRMLLEGSGETVNKMLIFAAAYDAKAVPGKPDNLFGILQVPRLDNNVIIAKAKQMIEDVAFYTDCFPDNLPSKCAETWGDKRCSGYCAVNFACPYFGSKGAVSKDEDKIIQF